VILYSAAALWRGMGLSYCSYLHADGTRNKSGAVMREAMVATEDARIVVNSPDLRVSGEWAQEKRSFKATIFENEAGAIVWDCLQPGAKARIRIGKRALTGLGYAEMLTMTLPPWQLPMRHLKWGRFVSERDAVAWIDWLGPYSRRLVIHNGRPCEAASVSDTTVTMDGSELRMDDALPLRRGPVGRTMIPGARALAKFFPKSMLNVEEQKWRSKGTLVTSEGESHDWVIHEAVDWNQ
jgi:hypothetical protein